MNIVITGASGFVGFNLSHYLMQKGHQVTLLDQDDYCQRLVHGSPLHDMPYIKCNLAEDRLHLPPGTDHIIHLAAMPHVDYSYHQPSEVFRNNTLSTQAILQYALTHGIPLLLASSVEVYGGEWGRVYRESDPYSPVSPYSASKVACETLAMSYAQCYQLPVNIFRLTNLYGPWQLPDRIIPRNFGRMLDGLPLDIQGSAVRDFLYIDDALRAIEQIMLSGQNGQTYNISSGIGTTMQEIGMLMEPLARSAEAMEIRQQEPTQSRGSSLVVHSGKLRSAFGWYPEITLEQGLEKTFQWYQEHADWVRQFSREYHTTRENRSFIIDMARYAVQAV
ncbi:GDP-mannose 4,6-dehydratase [Paenibacillus silvae]|uniref:NAD-dependent epimerase/dehydratase family protein n=1 Tax=Paenibacillus silvae TaxID=1325358 RepID=UPI0025A1FAF2|nr:NAD-dependent epimerase/dehydratase family protein [Paenibacillus silvae]MDM5280968.1 GDP-mannose 4,6-dehydratase [Paenibacillus silvae]